MGHNHNGYATIEKVLPNHLGVVVNDYRFERNPLRNDGISIMSDERVFKRKIGAITVAFLALILPKAASGYFHSKVKCH